MVLRPRLEDLRVIPEAASCVNAVGFADVFPSPAISHRRA